MGHGAVTTTKSLELMIGGLLEGQQNTQREIASLRHDLKESEARQALGYEQSETRAAASRAAMHTKTDQLMERMGTTENEVKSLKDDLVDVRAVTEEVTRWKQRGIGGLAIAGIGASAITFLLTKFGSEIISWFHFR